jgi:Mrp family chromosome partitioning ATPase/capsular polysaccharide biosynthesis protein
VNGRSFLLAVWRRRWLALLVLVVEMAAVIVWLSLAPKKYTATARTTASPGSTLLPTQGDFSQLELTLAQIVDSGPIMQQVSQKIGGKRSASVLQSEVTGTLTTGTYIITVQVVDEDPALARDIANDTVDAMPTLDPSGGLLVFASAGRATTPTAYSSPNTKVVLLAGFGLGLLLAIATALFRESAVGTVDFEDQLRDLTGADLLGELSRPADVSALSVMEPGSEFVVEFRALRVALEFASSEQPARNVVLASAVPDSTDGWLGVNLAVALAEVAHRVLVIDADFRDRPRHPALNLPDRPGLGDVLRGTTSLDSAIVDGPVDGMQVLPIGSVGDASAATLVELRFHKLMSEVDNDFDLVLVLASPPSESEDARIMAVGGTLVLIVPANRVRTKALRRLVAAMQRVNIPIMGTVLVGTRRRSLI